MEKKKFYQNYIGNYVQGNYLLQLVENNYFIVDFLIRKDMIQGKQDDINLIIN